jgi:uncharacterized protein (TIGR02453 family)
LIARKLFLDEDIYPPFSGFPAEGITFLRQLKRNNNREWFKRNKERYEEFVKFPMQSLIASMRAPMSVIAPEIDINPGKNMFRIYRDTRFSKNKAPYKTHVAAVFHPKGHWESSAGFYLHIEPEGVYAGGGIYMPNGQQLKKIRRAIAGQPEDFLSIVENKRFRKIFGSLEGEKLRRAPLGFSVDHPMIEWLKYKQFYTGVEWNVATSHSAKFVTNLVTLYKNLLPFVRFFNGVL